MIPIILQTEFSLGDRVHHKTSDDLEYIVIGFIINTIDRDSVVTSYSVRCSTGERDNYELNPLEIEKIVTETNY